MSFSILATIRRALAPQHELSCSVFLWVRLLTALRSRGRGRTRESGAFLLGHRRDGRARVTGFALYDDLDPTSLDSGIVRFSGDRFGELWNLCARIGVTVVADVHVHPGSAEQSGSDQAHPMIPCEGHIALILPRFAAPPVRRREIGIYRYLGGKRWRAVPAQARSAFLLIDL
jgi:hypothetical protein